MRNMNNKCIYKYVNFTFSESHNMIYIYKKDQQAAHFSVMI